MRTRTPDPLWSSADEALLHTCRLAAAVERREDLRAVPSIVGSFPPRLGPDEQLWVCGAYAAYEHVAVGDGTYRQNSFIVGGTGPLGLALLATTFGVDVLRRKQADERARADMQPRWVESQRGDLWVGRYGFYLQSSNSQLLPWSWHAISQAEVDSPHNVHLVGATAHGPVAWMLHSVYAELVFVLWALTCHPGHPQLQNGAWLPPGWLERARARYRNVPHVAGRLAAGAGP
jgi:hypothetical protein